MARRALSWALVLVVAWTCRPAVAQTASPLKAIPSDVAVVVRVKGLQGTLNKIAGLADAVQPGSGQTVKLGGALLGGVLKNPTMEGVDMAGDFYVTVFVEKDAAPGIAFLVPAKDLAAMEEALGDEVTFVKGDKHGIYSDDEEVANSFKDQLKSKDKDSLGDKIDEKSLAALNRGDISVYVNVPELLEVYKDEFQGLQAQLETIGDQKPENETPGVNTAVVMKKLQDVVTTLVKAIEDHDGITLALSVTDKEIVIEEFFKLDNESATGKKLKGGTGSEMPLLNSLPADALGYYALQCNLGELITWSMEFAEAVITDEKALEAIKGTAKELKGVKFTGLAGAVNLSDKTDEGLLSIVNLMLVDAPQKFRAVAKKYADEVKEVEANGTKTEVSYESDAEKIGKTSIDISTTKITVSDDAPGAEQQRAMLKVLYGGEGAKSRMAFLKDKIVQVTGGGKPAMEAALKAVESPAKSPAANVQAVKAKLGTKPNFVGLLDLANLAVKGLGLAKEFGGDDLPFDPKEVVEGINLTPSYIGFGVEVQDAAVSVKTVVPADQIKNLVQLGMKTYAAVSGEKKEDK